MNPEISKEEATGMTERKLASGLVIPYCKVVQGHVLGINQREFYASLPDHGGYECPTRRCLKTRI